MKQEPSKPLNIVIYLADDLGYNDTGCYGSEIHKTPNIDRLAEGGVRFTDFHSNGCMCSPTRAALLTGRYQQRCGMEYGLGNAIKHNGPRFGGISPEETTYGRAFAEHGYATGFFGKFHTAKLPDFSPLNMGFQEFCGINGGMDHHSRFNRSGERTWWVGRDLAQEEGYATDLIADHALDFIKRHQSEPFLLYLADWCVHFPWQGPNDPADFAEGVDNSGTPEKWGSQYPNEHKRAYKEMTEAQDRNVGRIAAKLEELGLAENTLFIFISDNGGHSKVTDNAPLRGGKSQLFEGGHRVPAVFSWPGTIPSGRTSLDTALTMDVFPTLLSLAGLEPPDGLDFDGMDMSAHLLNGAPLPERTLFWRYGEQALARRGEWKYLKRGEEMLFDLASDLSEERNLIADKPALAKDLKEAFAEWEKDVETNRLPPYWL